MQRSSHTKLQGRRRRNGSMTNTTRFAGCVLLVTLPLSCCDACVRAALLTMTMAASTYSANGDTDMWCYREVVFPKYVNLTIGSPMKLR